MEQNWTTFYNQESIKPYFISLSSFLKSAYLNEIIFPPKKDMFNAFKMTPFQDVKVVILGQDPYHNENQAMGLSFSVAKGINLPKSLQNIYKEIESDLDIKMAKHGDLTYWANQGVLLINTILTVVKNKPLSHQSKGWEIWSEHVMCYLNEKTQPVVFLLWGRNAQQYARFITNPNHLILKAPHPSPLSAHQGFFGCRHFSRTNVFLEQHSIRGIDWQIT